MDKNVFLENEAAKRLYRTVNNLPIIDYHCHLSPAEILQDKPFDNIGQMWLAGDHYKWRLMRACGIDEAYITGEASWKDKFLQYARAVSASPGNPLYHWTHIELQMYFQIDTPLSAKTAEDIWLRANKAIAEQKLSPRKIIAASRVRYIATTDDPADDLAYHEKIAEDKGFETTVSPCFRTDALLSIRQSGYPRYIEKLSGASGIQIGDMDTLEAAVKKRLDFFCLYGCKFSDVGLPEFPASFATRSKADATFKKAVNGEPVTDAESVNGAYVLRLYEAERSRTRVELCFSHTPKRVFLTNMLEDKKEELTVSNGGVTLEFHLFEIKTLLVERD